MSVDYKVFTAEDGTDIYYIDFGKGTPIVYAHGFCGSTEQDLSMFDLLKDQFRCICFDQRGYGKTEGRGEIGIQQSARDITSLLKHLGIKNATLLGYSMGAAVLFSYVEQFGCDRVERIIIGDMTPKIINEDNWKFGLYQGRYTRDHYESDLKNIRNNYEQFILFLVEQIVAPNKTSLRNFDYDLNELKNRIIRNIGAGGTEMINAMVGVLEEQKKSSYFYWKSMCEPDFRGTLKNITVPTAVIFADPGSIYYTRTAEYIASQIEDAVLYRMRSCTHMAKNDKPKEFVCYIRDFCKITGPDYLKVRRSMKDLHSF
ncbi:alpha/beta hydrolase [Sporolactobacillus sp. CQH2019]|uniref:alpha/beta fold hydrolase n=1 Tax=Sporolactobacillus sp. CQH2019 TaxID=3023512 RepID=UPI0023687530|nr:alpha/beta hydrolase [Sporolactobacillus sp. CQH2019]MDD9148180.1 alpha/beta hydrolase [Sporolactobacillus sp. CQH2019]